MSSFLNPDALRLFFGPHFDVDVAMDAVMRYQGVNVLKGELRDSATTGVPVSYTHLTLPTKRIV